VTPENRSVGNSGDHGTPAPRGYDGRDAFVAAYLRVAGEEGFLPSTPEDRAVLLDGVLLERAVDDLENALLHRPSAVSVTMEHLSRLLRNA